MKKKIFLLSVVVICFAMLASGTIAYFTTKDVAHNVISTGEISIALQEWADEEKTTPFPETGVDGVLPGCSVTKIVEVKNTGVSDAWVRIALEKTFDLAEGVEIAPDMALLEIDLNTADWTEKDGYWYYNEIVKPGETTMPLFTTVTFAPRMGNDYANSVASLDVSAQAVQSANNGAAVLEAAGWPA